ncbi:MAG: hypothetical protein M1833_004623 [Piccolia ochrophora]|nr:MAG: hypothetical protein M1833_004623 [Piccolia ochrophora]
MEAPPSISSLSRPITPPCKASRNNAVAPTPAGDITTKGREHVAAHEASQARLIRSPFQLTRIQDLSATNNVDTLTLEDILGDPLIKECWQFNYLFDLDFVMQAFDEDVRDLVSVNVVHGFWKTEDGQRRRMVEAANRFRNIKLITAYMPEPFGTHHSKMMVLIRHDDCAQIVIHTANMIHFDWTNMTQAVWRSPALPLLSTAVGRASSTSHSLGLGSGKRFKDDLLAYLRAYGHAKTGLLTDELKRYDFSAIRGALVASVPARQNTNKSDPTKRLWGWMALKDIVNSIPVRADTDDLRPQIVVQVSSIATLGQTDQWLRNILFDALEGRSAPRFAPGIVDPGNKPKFHMIFPTADEIRRSLNGYLSGSAIHTKIKTPAQAKQIAYLKPMLRHWAGDGGQHENEKKTTFQGTVGEAGRKRAAPHIKTYIRFTDSSMKKIDWAMMTSANLSTQAWGTSPNASGEVRVSSWEIGVIVWPGLWGGNDHRNSPTTEVETATMVPVFRTDTLVNDNQAMANDTGIPVIGLRMAYDLPLVSYHKDDMPWCATSSYNQPDWMGQTHNSSSNGYGDGEASTQAA